jgi:hypothetical protein
METQVASLIDCFKERTIIFETAVEAKAPQAICLGVGFVGLCLVLLIVSLHCVNNADANFGNQVVSWSQSAAVWLSQLRK